MALRECGDLLTQICLALSALILQVVAHGNPIEQLFYSLRNLQSEDNGNIAVLEMLTVLPEEVVDNQPFVSYTYGSRVPAAAI
ncbi:transportin-3-like [Trifolium medium]|uniref:Transportin-3-like n=1 Tax=Trifolium medium TaxID=97028 RepID=A0A392QNT1_9FABA|nr:transportin-3-like [Trifolium medium]